MTISLSFGRRRRDWIEPPYRDGMPRGSYWTYYSWWRPHVWFYPADKHSHWGAGVGWLWVTLRAGGGL